MKRTVKYLKLFWYQIFVHLKLKLLDFLSDFVLMRRTIAVPVRYKSLYISLPSFAKQQREMTKFCVFWGTRTAAAQLELNAGVAYVA